VRGAPPRKQRFIIFVYEQQFCWRAVKGGERGRQGWGEGAGAPRGLWRNECRPRERGPRSGSCYCDLRGVGVGHDGERGRGKFARNGREGGRGGGGRKKGGHHLRPMTEREKSASAGPHFRPLPRSTRSGGSEDLEAAGPLGNRPCIRAREGIRDWPEYAARIKGPGRDIKSWARGARGGGGSNSGGRRAQRQQTTSRTSGQRSMGGTCPKGRPSPPPTPGTQTKISASYLEYIDGGRGERRAALPASGA
jgi:hypothetical protein